MIRRDADGVAARLGALEDACTVARNALADRYRERDTAYGARIAELAAAYAAVPGVTHTFWAEHEKYIDIGGMRARGLFNTPGMANARLLAYVREVVPPHRFAELIGGLVEDGAFDCVTEVVDGVTVSRDLLETILELHWLETVLGTHFMRSVVAVDIGAGYGRLAHWLTTAYPDSYVYATDAIPRSTVCCEAYMRYRRADRVEVVPLHRLAEVHGPIELAMNVHSWSECTLPSIGFWLDWLADMAVPRLFIVPHDARFRCADTSGQSYYPLLAQHGYRQTRHWGSRPAVDFGVSGPRGYYLFERSTGSAGQTPRSQKP